MDQLIPSGISQDFFDRLNLGLSAIIYCINIGKNQFGLLPKAQEVLNDCCQKILPGWLSFPCLLHPRAEWWLMQVWLQKFAYHIQISVWVFNTSGTAALTIALLTVSLQSLKAAIVNPVKNLRGE